MATLAKWATWACLIHCLGLPLLSIGLSMHVGASDDHIHVIEIVLVACACLNGVIVAWCLLRFRTWPMSIGLLMGVLAALIALATNEETLLIVALIELGILQIVIERTHLCHHHPSSPASS